ncbi:hypothetical protein B0T20DRAFT_30793 [Sordaria brevicollis]|uniref:Uncharacterized protein n=1 Tax=Sordaria brevicollis TaxID=83679 RepID=A0AAE0PQ25_SORBR|nr:hypothetical protein B0T20DRAFT_30793 [Sordaria brevicollis]
MPHRGIERGLPRTLKTLRSLNTISQRLPKKMLARQQFTINETAILVRPRTAPSNHFSQSLGLGESRTRKEVTDKLKSGEKPHSLTIPWNPDQTEGTLYISSQQLPPTKIMKFPYITDHRKQSPKGNTGNVRRRGVVVSVLLTSILDSVPLTFLRFLSSESGSPLSSPMPTDTKCRIGNVIRVPRFPINRPVIVLGRAGGSR